MAVLECRIVQDVPLAALLWPHGLLLLGEWLQTHGDVDVVVQRVRLVEWDEDLRGCQLPFLAHHSCFVFVAVDPWIPGTFKFFQILN